MREINSEILIEEPALIEKDVTPKDLLSFAKIILFVIAILFALGGLADLINPECHIFEACKTILPPIATLVIGFYFGANK